MRNARMKSTNTSGIKGVSKDRRSGKWIVRIRTDEGKYGFFGNFEDIEDAAKQAREVRERLHGEFARHD